MEGSRKLLVVGTLGGQPVSLVTHTCLESRIFEHPTPSECKRALDPCVEGISSPWVGT